MTVSQAEAHRMKTERLKKAAASGRTLVLRMIGFSENGKTVRFDETVSFDESDTSFDGPRLWLCPENGRHYSSFNVEPR